MPTQRLEVGETRFEFEHFSEEKVEQFVSAIKRIELKTNPLELSDVRNAFVYPAQALSSGLFGGGIFDETGAPVRQARIRRANLGVVLGGGPARDFPPRSDRIPSAIFGGVIFGGHGHVVMESINRLWAAKADPTLPILFLGRKPRSPGNHFHALVEYLGVDPARIITVDRPHWIDRLILPEPGLELGLSINMNYLAFLHGGPSRRCGNDQPSGPASSCYLSRSGLGEAFRSGYGEHAFEAWLSTKGVSIIRPETLPLQEQISIVNTFDRFSGLIGSQMHNLIFRAKREACDVVYFCGGDPKPNFFQLDLVLPGHKVYCQAASYDPLFEFGHRAPFHLRLDRARATIGRVEGFDGADAGVPAIVPDVAFARTWFKNFFDSRVFSRRALARPEDIERSDAWLQSMMALLAQKTTRPLDETEIADAVRAFDESAARHRMGGDGAVIEARTHLAALGRNA